MRRRTPWISLVLACFVAGTMIPGCLLDFDEFDAKQGDEGLGGAGGISSLPGGAVGDGDSGVGDGDSSGGAGDGDDNDPPLCPAGEKMCGSSCVAVDDPQFGCEEESCTPCSTASHVEAICNGGQCEEGACASGFLDCDGDKENGCEHVTSDDSVTRCGGCDADCTTLGLRECQGGRCGCTADSQCAGNAGNRIHACVDSLCECTGVTCNVGEICRRQMGEAVCSCGGGEACAEGRVCCPTATGASCQQIDGSDASNCGACGLVCPAGYICDTGICRASSKSGN